MNDDIAMIMLPKVRCSFLHLEKPHAPPNSTEARYSADFLLDKQNASHIDAWNKFTQTLQQMAQEKWKEMAPAILQQIDNDPKLRGYGEGNTRVKKSDMSILEGYQDMIYISAKSTTPPQIIGGDGKAIDPNNALQRSKKPYAGCYVNALLKVWLQDNQYGRAVRFDLIAVQFAEDGSAFGPTPMDAAETEGYFKPIAGAPQPVAQPPGQTPGSTLLGNGSDNAPPWQ